MDEHTSAETTVEPQAQEIQETPTEETQVEAPTDETDVNTSQETTPVETTESLEQVAQPEQIEEDEEEDNILNSIPQAPQIQQVDIGQFVTQDPNTGEQQIDYQAYHQAMQTQMAASMQAATQQAVQQTELMNKYEKVWDDAYTEFPQLKGKTPESKQLRDMVQAIHANSALPGAKYLSPKAAAKQLFGIRSQGKAEGMKAAQESRQVQSAANLGNPNPPATDVGNNSADTARQRMTKGKTKAEREQGVTDLISEMIKSGKL